MKQEIKIENLFLNISINCNMHCERCFRHLYESSTVNMSLETAQNATKLYFLNKINNTGLSYIMFFGGEPLINWNLLTEYIPWVTKVYRAKSFRLFMFTNGLELDDDKLDFLAKYNVLIFVSIDGDYSHYHTNRKISMEQYDNIIMMCKKYLEKKPYGIIPYCVVNRKTLPFLESVLTYISVHGFRIIGISKEFGEFWNINEKISLIKTIINVGFNKNIKILPYPEIVANCNSCYPASMMVYPDGFIYDLCYVCGATLFQKSILTSDEKKIFRMGHVLESDKLLMDVQMKKKIITRHTSCPTVSRYISYFKPYYPLIGKNIHQFF